MLPSSESGRAERREALLLRALDHPTSPVRRFPTVRLPIPPGRGSGPDHPERPGRARPIACWHPGRDDRTLAPDQAGRPETGPRSAAARLRAAPPGSLRRPDQPGSVRRERRTGQQILRHGFPASASLMAARESMARRSGPSWRWRRTPAPHPHRRQRGLGRSRPLVRADGSRCPHRRGAFQRMSKLAPCIRACRPHFSHDHLQGEGKHVGATSDGPSESRLFWPAPDLNEWGCPAFWCRGPP